MGVGLVGGLAVGWRARGRRLWCWVCVRGVLGQGVHKGDQFVLAARDGFELFSEVVVVFVSDAVGFYRSEATKSECCHADCNSQQSDTYTQFTSQKENEDYREDKDYRICDGEPGCDSR